MPGETKAKERARDEGLEQCDGLGQRANSNDRSKESESDRVRTYASTAASLRFASLGLPRPRYCLNSRSDIERARETTTKQKLMKAYDTKFRKLRLTKDPK